MSGKSSRWELVFATFVMLCCIFLGVGYVIAINFSVGIPWLILVVVAAVLTWLFDRKRQQRGL
ncbi:MAG: hypothetical protein Fur005_33500 [Roseiflexaceae bacterium]